MKTNKEYILDFIANLNIDPSVSANFHRKLSYWWASIMYARFAINPDDSSTIIFNPTDKMFAIIINGTPYDARGPIPMSAMDDYIGWDAYIVDEPVQANEILRTYVYMIKDKDKWNEFCLTLHQNNE